MTPSEISNRFGSDALDKLYDSILQSPAHVLADWVLACHTEEQISEWVEQLTNQGESK